MSYYTQTAVLRAVTGHDDYGQPTRAAPVTIAVRWEYQSPTRSIGATTQEAASEKSLSAVFTEAALHIEDELTFDGRVYHVFGDLSVPTLDGYTLGREFVAK